MEDLLALFSRSCVFRLRKMKVIVFKFLEPWSQEPRSPRKSWGAWFRVLRAPEKSHKYVFRALEARAKIPQKVLGSNLCSQSESSEFLEPPGPGAKIAPQDFRGDLGTYGSQAPKKENIFQFPGDLEPRTKIHQKVLGTPQRN